MKLLNRKGNIPELSSFALSDTLQLVPDIRLCSSWAKYEPVVCPTSQLSELSIGMSEVSEQQKLTPGMIMITGNQMEREPEPFTVNLMISPTADRNHPLFKQFLSTVKELEKQMLFEYRT
ncbi:unnamed protein product [Strongylus vulgaris]|uniref:Uncharacterized protein n=1 Tax=Strongylus vulgaris TaxID=40348 RepID=A0A3P7IHZ3_STRVU|nr:unnamed protein product [Strongylus vulgaris]